MTRIKLVLAFLAASAFAGCGSPCEGPTGAAGDPGPGPVDTSAPLQCVPDGVGCTEDATCRTGISGDKRCCDLTKGWCVVCADAGPNS